MCDIRRILDQDCQHRVEAEWLWCATARHRQPPATCPNPLPSDDPRDVVPGRCPACLGSTPPESDP